MPDTTTYVPKVGDRVHVDPNGLGVPAGVLGRTFVVAKINPKNVKCSATDGGRGLNFPAYLLLAGDAPARGTVGTVTTFAIPEMFDTGEIVTLRRPMAGTRADLPYVVIKCDGGGKVNLARLGGDQGRYVRASVSSVVRRDAAWLAEQLIASL